MNENLQSDDLSLRGVPRTMLLTMLARARESRRPNPLFRDRKAEEMAQKIEKIFRTEKGDRRTESGVIVRTGVIDTYVKDFIKTHPDALCINIGCGLDTRYFRVRTEDLLWVDADLPEVISLRHKLLGETPGVKMVARSFLDPSWTEELPREDRPVLIIMEGLLMYFTEEEVRSALETLHSAYPKAELILELLSDRIVGNEKLTRSIQKTGSVFRFGVSSGKEMEKICPFLEFLEEESLSDHMWKKNRIFRILSKIPAIHNLSNRICRFRFRA